MVNQENFSYHELKNETDENFNQKIYTEFLKRHPYMTKKQMIVKLKNIIDDYICPQLEYTRALNILSNNEASDNIKNLSSRATYSSTAPSTYSTYSSTAPTYLQPYESSITPVKPIQVPTYVPYETSIDSGPIKRCSLDERTGKKDCQECKANSITKLSDCTHIENFLININSVPVDSNAIMEYISGSEIETSINKILPALNNASMESRLLIKKILNKKNLEAMKCNDYYQTLGEIYNKYNDKSKDTALSEKEKNILLQKMKQIDENMKNNIKLSYDAMVNSMTIEDSFPEMINNAKSVAEYNAAMEKIIKEEQNATNLIILSNENMLSLINSKNKPNIEKTTSIVENKSDGCDTYVIIIIIVLFKYDTCCNIRSYFWYNNMFFKNIGTCMC